MSFRLPVFVLLLVFVACSSQPRFRPDPDSGRRAGKESVQRGGERAPRPERGGAIEGRGLLASASRYLGTPYRYGGETAAGMDCSGLVWRAARDAWGMTIPRVSRDQASLGMPVMPAEMRRDDLVFFSINGSRIDHVGIYEGRGRFLHASSSSGVTWSSLDEPYWKARFRQARRVNP